MDREILFRGKQLNNGEWFYGIPFISESGKFAEMKQMYSYECQVIPETIGQYTGLKDKNGTKIFEGDIIKHGLFAKSVVEYGWGKFIAHRLFNSKEFKNIDDYNNDEFMDLIETTWGNVEVIGNIHDTPELLGGR